MNRRPLGGAMKVGEKLYVRDRPLTIFLLLSQDPAAV